MNNATKMQVKYSYEPQMTGPTSSLNVYNHNLASYTPASKLNLLAGVYIHVHVVR